MQVGFKDKQAHVEFIDELLCWLTPNGFITSVRPALLELTGWNEKDWLEKDFRSLLHPDDVADFEKQFRGVLLGRSVVVPGARCLAKNGVHLSADLLFVPVIAKEAVTRVICVGQKGGFHPNPVHAVAPANVIPFPDSRESETRAPFSNTLSGLTDLLETLLANSPIGVALLDRELRFICVNQTLVIFHGFSPEQHLGRTVWDLDPQMAAVTVPLIKRVLETGVPVTDREVTVGAAAHPDLAKCCLVSFYPVRSHTGEIVNIAEMVVDITDRKRVERALRESEDRFRLAIESASFGTWDLNLLTGKLLWSDRTKEMVGLSPDANVSYRVFLSALHPYDRARVEKAIQEAKNPRGNGDYRVEYRTIGIEDKVERWLSVHGKVYFDDKKTPTRFTGIALEISEQKRAEEALRRATRELSRSNEALENFAYVVSHDLKEPLRMISSFVRLLGQRYRGKLDPDADSYIAFAVNGAERMRVLIDDVLSYAKAGREERPLERVQSQALLGNALHMLRLSIHETGTVITQDTLPEVDADPRQLQQVFQNLIQNAIKFRKKEEPPRIHVQASREESEWHFSIRDNGIGVDPGKLKDVFLPLRRLHSVADYPGSGLGLAICEKNIARHRGRIWVESEPEKGSVFHFTLPTGESHDRLGKR